VTDKNNMNLQGKDNLVKWRKPAFFLSITAMLVGLLFSRALLSSGLIFFAFASLFHKNIIQQLKDFLTSPVLWSMSLLFVLPAISGFWNEDISQWAQILRIKLPLPGKSISSLKIAFSYLFDIGLEVQFRVFVPSFMLL
jgi:hypothetical protein